MADHELQQAREELDKSIRRFEETPPDRPELLDAAIFAVKAAELRLNSLIRIKKEEQQGTGDHV